MERCLAVCYTPSISSRHTYTHTPAVLEYLSEVSWLGPRLGTALPNHIAASKSSVYISNYIVAHGVLEHSGRSPFHLCAVSRPPPSLHTHAHTHFPYFFPLFPSPLFLHPYLFISISLIFVVVSVDRAPSGGTHLPADLRPLNSASQGRADRRGGSGIIFDDLFIVLLQFAGGSQYNIHLSMHNTGWDQSWVKDNSKDCRLGLGLWSRRTKKLPRLLLHCPDLCGATVLCYPFPDCLRLYKRNNGAAKCMRMHMIFHRWYFTALPIYLWTLNSRVFPPFWISLMKEGPEHLGVLSAKMTFLLFIGVCLSTARPWLFFGSPLLCSEPCYWTGRHCNARHLTKSQAWRWRVGTTFNIGMSHPFRPDN